MRESLSQFLQQSHNPQQYGGAPVQDNSVPPQDSTTGRAEDAAADRTPSPSEERPTGELVSPPSMERNAQESIPIDVAEVANFFKERRDDAEPVALHENFDEVIEARILSEVWPVQ